MAPSRLIFGIVNLSLHNFMLLALAVLSLIPPIQLLKIIINCNNGNYTPYYELKDLVVSAVFLMQSKDGEVVQQFIGYGKNSTKSQTLLLPPKSRWGLILCCSQCDPSLPPCCVSDSKLLRCVCCVLTAAVWLTEFSLCPPISLYPCFLLVTCFVLVASAQHYGSEIY